MSITTASLGWAVLNKRNNVQFYISYVTMIYLGMSLAELNQTIGACSKIALRVRQDENKPDRICYYTESGSLLFSVNIVSGNVTRIWYAGIERMIPQELLYKFGRKTFITNTRVDGYMMAVKGTDEVYLKLDEAVPACDVTSESLGVVVQRQTKKTAGSMSSAWSAVQNTRNVYGSQVYNMKEQDVKKLESDYNSLVRKRDKLLDSKNEVEAELRKYNAAKRDAENEYEKCMKAYAVAVEETSDDVYELRRLGKLRVDYKCGRLLLVEDSDTTANVRKSVSVPVYKNVVERHNPDMVLHEDYEEYQDRCKSEGYCTTERKFMGYREEEKVVLITDTDFMLAKEIVAKLNPLWERREKAEKRLNEIKRESPKHELIQRLDGINAELEVMNRRVDILGYKLYG